MSKAAELAALIGSQTALSNRNLIINGKFSIFQRGTGATTVNGNDVFAADRFKGWANGGGTYTVEQSTDVPNNEFEYSAKLTNTGVDSSVAAGDNYRWATDIEGYNVSQLGYGHSDAKAVTLSFWVKSSLAGTYCGALYSTTASRHYIYEYTISSANTWEKKTITVSSGDTTGSWNKTNGNGLRIYWGFGSGSTYQGTAGAWTAGEKWETSNQAAWIGSASATFFITGVQLELGETATPFEHRSFGDELARCQRYYYRTPTGQAYQRQCVLTGRSSVNTDGIFILPVSMRSQPTFSKSGTMSVEGNTTKSISSISLSTNASSTDRVRLSVVSDSGLTAGYSYYIFNVNDASAYLDFDAEL